MIAATMIAAAVVTTIAGTAPVDGGTLEIRVDGLRSAKGQGAFALYDSADSFRLRANPVASAVREIRDGTTEWIVEGLPVGDYAVAFYHDRNENGRLDRNKLGVPREPYGFSQDARGTFGPPSFDEARFRYDGAAESIEFRAR